MTRFCLIDSPLEGIGMARPRGQSATGLFRPILEQIIDMGYPLVRLAGKIDWGFSTPAGRGLRARRRPAAVAGAAGGGSVDPQAHAFAEATKLLCSRWIENPYVPEWRGRGSRARFSSKLLDWEYQPAA